MILTLFVGIWQAWKKYVLFSCCNVHVQHLLQYLSVPYPLNLCGQKPDKQDIDIAKMSLPEYPLFTTYQTQNNLSIIVWIYYIRLLMPHLIYPNCMYSEISL